MAALHLSKLSTILLQMMSWVLAEDPITIVKTTSLGMLRGYTESVLEKDIQIFLGIPFAKPPNGTRRFQKPEPFGPWPGIQDATKLPNSCPQKFFGPLDGFVGVTMWNSNTPISEDCLFLNVWAPSSDPPSGGHPVMVWIHGGGFTIGSSTLSWYDGRILSALGNVIVMSMQYRVGALGFLYLGTKDFPGNMGLLDQVLALKWIQDNVADYGGDPSRVTIFGESAGAGSVGYHLISPVSQNLFQRAILQSGSVLSSWAADKQSDALDKSKNMAVAVGCTELNHDLLTKCLMDVPHEVFSENVFIPLIPTVDGVFLQRTPEEIVKDQTFKKTEILIGVNKHEGALLLPLSLPKLYNITSRSITTKEVFLEAVGILVHTDDPILKEVISFEYMEPYHYRSEKPHYTDMLEAITSDQLFNCPVMKFAKAYTKAEQNVYMYEFAHNMPSNPWPDWMGVLHGYELDAVFGIALNESLQEYSDSDRNLSKRVALHWINFAVSGDPSLTADQMESPYDWPLYTISDRNVLLLNLSVPAPILDGVWDRKCAFWEHLDKIKLTRREEQDSKCGCSSCLVNSMAIITSIILSQVVLTSRV